MIKKELICIVGPTAVGKTALSISIAKELGAEIISADSRQVYRYMDIGTAKPDLEQQADVRHHLIDICNPDEPFNAGRFERCAAKKVDEITKRGNVPLLVGGTGLYLRALVYGLAESPPQDAGLRQELEAEGGLFEKLQQVDPETAKRVHPHDRSKILRALEVFFLSGKTISFFQSLHRFQKTRYNTIIIGLRRPRQELYRRIEQRVDLMMAAGFVDEVAQLINAGYDISLPSMSSLGYRQIGRYLSGGCSRHEAVQQMVGASRKYAKRQMTWFNKTKGLLWVDITTDASSSGSVSGSCLLFNEVMKVIYERREVCQELE